MTRYSRQDVLRILHLHPRQLAAWEQAGLVERPDSEKAYTFAHIAQLQALRELRGRRLSPGRIRASMQEMQKLSGVRNALSETSAVRRGSGVAWRQGGSLVNPLTRQLAFDFETIEWQGKALDGGFSRAGRSAPAEAGGQPGGSVQEMFLRGVQLEESESTVGQATQLYELILKIKPDHAPTCINLGTIFYNQRDFGRAEQMYRRATEADPHYALAFFDLGNVLDEMQRLDEAIEAYGRAIAIVPQYADAHYNLALAYERQGERRRALRHWTAYVRLDPVGPWATHAKGQARKILSMERLSIVSRRGRRVAAG